MVGSRKKIGIFAMLSAEGNFPDPVQVIGGIGTGGILVRQGQDGAL
jgi:hypothetical protein